MVSDITGPSSKVQSTLSLYGSKNVKEVKEVKEGQSTSQVGSSAPLEDTVSLSSPAFLEKISQVQGFLEQISIGESAVSTALDNVDAVTAKLEEAGGVAVRAREVLRSSVAPDLVKPQVEELRVRFDNILNDIDNLSQNSGFPGENLLAGDDVSFAIDESDRGRLEIEGLDVSSSHFGLDNAAFRTDAEAEFIKNIVSQAIDQVALFRSQLSGVSYDLETRKSFSQDTIDVFLEDAQREQNLGNYNEGDALRSLQSKLSTDTDEPLALEAQFELLENFK